jgi:RNA polymerase sigma-70 factor (ECF subfamily)
MRRILVERARAKRRQKRGGGARRHELDEKFLAVDDRAEELSADHTSDTAKATCMFEHAAISAVSTARPAVFSTTHWSMVLAAGDKKSPEAKEALERLCGAYWYPIYAYVRRKGYKAEDAQDLTQEFFSRLVERNYLSVADRNRGKFRSFLLGSLEHFLAREWTKAHAQKRGGGRTVFSFDEANAEDRHSHEPAHQLSPGRIFERRWATTLLDQAMSRLREECAASQKGEFFTRIEPHLSGEKGDTSYAEIAAILRMSQEAVKVAVHRLRRRFGELIRAEIAQTVATPQEADEELHISLTCSAFEIACNLCKHFGQ